jgi:hypothetical protein
MEVSVDHFVKLDKLPDGLEFPPQFRDRIHFDAAARKLVFRGYMSKADFDQISQLTNDWKFRRTLEDLFRLSIPEPPAPSTGLQRIVARLRRLFTRG